MAEDTPKLPDQKEAEYDGRTVTLYDPFRIEDDEKKFGVYVENPDSGNVNKLKFGSDKMEIKRDDEEALDSFRARMQCEDQDQSDKHTAQFWSCVFWRSDVSVSELLDENQKRKEWKLRGEVRRLIREEAGQDGKFAKRKLKEINKFSRMLFQIIHRGDSIENWVMEKLISASNELNEIYQYMESDRMGL